MLKAVNIDEPNTEGKLKTNYEYVGSSMSNGISNNHCTTMSGAVCVTRFSNVLVVFQGSAVRYALPSVRSCSPILHIAVRYLTSRSNQSSPYRVLTWYSAFFRLIYNDAQLGPLFRKLPFPYLVTHSRLHQRFTG